MPYPFTLPTTSSLSYSSFLASNTHPSLILTATTYRTVLREALKKHKRLPLQSQAAELTIILSALNEYLPYLFALDSGLSGKEVSWEEVNVILQNDIEVEWRPCLVDSIAGRESPRVKGKGLDYELCWVLSTLAYCCSLLARVQLHSLYASTTPSSERRGEIVTAATKHLLQANSVHNYLVGRTAEMCFPSSTVDISGSTQSGLASLALAEATLLAVLKDDPYPAIIAQDRNSNDKEWMIKAPDIPKVRAHLFARLCLAAAEHAGQAHALFSSSKGSKTVNMTASIIVYAKDLRRTSRAKACRFFGIDAELGGKTGEAIAWLAGGNKELGFVVDADKSATMKGIAKLKKNWTERKEDKKVEKGGEWGSDAGRLEEARVIEMLAKKWNKTNDTINTQIIPSSDPLITGMPSGRDIHVPKSYNPPSLDESTLARMRSPPDDDARTLVDDSDDSSEGTRESRGDLSGIFPEPTLTDGVSYY